MGGKSAEAALAALYALQKNANYARHVTGYPTAPWRHEAAVVEYTHRIDQGCFQMKADI